MTEKTLRELWEEADDQVSRYKHPSIGEFVERIDPVLKACGVSIIGSDEVKSMGVYGNTAEINTAWSARSCPQTSTLQFPAFLLDHEDPVRAATLWRMEQRVKTLEDSLAALRSSVEKAEASLTVAQADLKRAREE